MPPLLKTLTHPVATRKSSALREIPFQVVSSSPTAIPLVPLSGGLCVPRGQLFDCSGWQVEGFEHGNTAAQIQVLNSWPDGSVCWMLVSLVAPILNPGRTNCTLVPSPNSGNQNPCANAQHHDANLKLELLDQQSQPLNLKLLGECDEICGTVRQVRVQQYEVTRLPFLKLQLRVERWATAGLQKVDVRIRNTRRATHRGGLWDLGDAGSVLLRGLHLKVNAPELHPDHVRWQLNADACTEPQVAPATENWQLVQYGSGSENWNSSNHIDALGHCTVVQRGYEVTREDQTINGLRSEPVLQVCSDDHCLGVAIPEFWQQFPGSLNCEAGQLDVGLFPKAADQCFELQGGEQKTRTVWLATGSSEASAASIDQRNEAAFAQLTAQIQPARMLQSSDWIADCKVIDWLPASLPKKASHSNDAQKTNCGQRFAAYVRQATTGEFTVTARREKIDEYGWRNFGDVHADHEQTHYSGPNTIISHYNNQFDLLFGGILNMIVSADADWFDLFDPLARHVMDIDIYHTNQDRACYNGGLFWHTDHYVDAQTATHRTYSCHNAGGGDYGGGLSCEHNYTTGLLFYHFLTGNPDARETVLSLADWVVAMDDGTKTVFGLLDSGPSGLASATVSEDFHGPGRGAGNSINALVDAWTLTADDKYLNKAEQLIQRVMHPDQDCDELHLSDAEGHWSYTVCMTAVGRYLSAKQAADQHDAVYEYARRTLVNYGCWMAANEQPALDHPERLQYPTEAWAAQEFRKANALRIAAACSPDAKQQQAMRERADQLNDAAWRDLYRFGNQHLTARCLSIVLTEGLRDIFHRSCPPDPVRPAEVELTISPWNMFVPQKARVKQLIKNPPRLLMSGFKLLNAKRILNTVDAVRRQR